MKKYLIKFLTGFMSITFFIFAGTSSMVIADTATTTITIFHTNDLHGHLIDEYNSAGTLTTIGMDYVAAIRNSVPDSLLVDAGDSTQGVPFANISKGKDVIKLTNAARYDVGVLGNHEFDFGLNAALTNVKNANYPILSANTIYNKLPFLKDIKGIGITENNGCNLIKMVNGIKVGFFGITTPETAYKTNPSYLKDSTSSVTFEDPITISQQEINKLKAEGAQVIVGIMHIGNEPTASPNSIDIANQLSGLNILIDAHSHTVENNVVNGTLIAQVGCYGEALGRIDVTVSDNGEVSSKETLINPADAQKTYTPDPAIKTLAEDLSNKQSTQFQKVIGHTSSVLWGGVVDDTSVARLVESNLGDLVADAMADNAREHIADTNVANLPVVALENGGGVRESIPAGDITFGHVSTVLPFGNLLSLKEVTPNILYQILENGVSKIGGQDLTTGVISGADGRFPQVSGMRFSYNPNGSPSNTSLTPAVTGNRIKQIVLLNSDGSDMQTLDRNDTSTKIVLATNDYENAGGDGYTMLSDIKNIGEGDALDVITANYIKKLTNQGNGTFSYPNSQNRICVDTDFIYPNYIAAITLTDKNGTIANKQVLYNLDNTSAAYGTTDENGILTITNLTSGAHTIYVYHNDNCNAAYVNDIIGKTAAASEMTAQSDEQKIAHHMMKKILALPFNITSSNVDTVNAALESFKNLTEAQKDLIANASLLISKKEIALSISAKKENSSTANPNVTVNNSFIFLLILINIITAICILIIYIKKNK
ncbi:bifunctional metallophosphatase/5'-nucleotidase [Anaerosacchariphilus polymeriproducens]|uniref:Bifunctional metallophosphatase/5'-nucleotidase n=1 Tax=Anaerosacchariphilus polymeriproducens TaxID=1812858 RepID=A0A371AYK5_9FIRM|nr:bifunctional UDP-sugar hydrolase/5'-nucleotidase [Anaerosacchariphilus polymeriproducens]RDU24633.1 bifunctional metallophosphatase/5'-nucleotidase [Anaerosacchariphilus polymeriproducens]